MKYNNLALRSPLLRVSDVRMAQISPSAKIAQSSPQDFALICLGNFEIVDVAGSNDRGERKKLKT